MNTTWVPVSIIIRVSWDSGGPYVIPEALRYPWEVPFQNTCMEGQLKKQCIAGTCTNFRASSLILSATINYYRA